MMLRFLWPNSISNSKYDGGDGNILSDDDLVILFLSVSEIFYARSRFLHPSEYPKILQFSVQATAYFCVDSIGNVLFVVVLAVYISIF